MDITLQIPKIPQKLFFRIGEVAGLLGLEPHVIRYWESEFNQLRPRKTNTNQRRYDRAGVMRIALVQYLLHTCRHSITHTREKLKTMDVTEEGIKGQLDLLSGVETGNAPQALERRDTEKTVRSGGQVDMDMKENEAGSFLEQRQQLQGELEQLKVRCKELKAENARLSKEMDENTQTMDEMQDITLGGVKRVLDMLDERESDR
ncbi:MAG: hypothetical protein CMH54_04095 [Myxococcales bacterium]|nr:hypothetical protein [Myxococcales bacterium]